MGTWATVDTSVLKLWPYSTGTNRPSWRWTNKWRGKPKPFLFYTQDQDKKSANVWWLVYMLSAVFLCMPAQWEPLHSVLRVGVLGWLRPIVLHNQPAKSTSSTSDRLMNVWFWKKTKARLMFRCTVIVNNTRTMQWSNYQMNEAAQGPTIKNFSSALSDGFLIKLHRKIEK